MSSGAGQRAGCRAQATCVCAELRENLTSRCLCPWTSLPIFSLKRSKIPLPERARAVFHLSFHLAHNLLLTYTPKRHILVRVWSCSLMLYFKEVVLKHLYHSKGPTFKVSNSLSLILVFIIYANEIKVIFHMKYLVLYPVSNFIAKIYSKYHFQRYRIIFL